MRVVLLTDGIYPFVLGGMQKHSYYLAKFLAQKNIFVDLYHCVPSNEQLPKALNCFTDLEKQFITNHPLALPKRANYPGHYLAECYKYSEQLYHLLLLQSKPDIIYVQSFSGWYLLKNKKKIIDIPVVVNFHGLNMFQKNISVMSKITAQIYRMAVKNIINKADYNISLGDRFNKILIKNGAKNIIELPIGIESAWLKNNINKENNCKKFVFIGRYESLKGINELHKAISKLPNDLVFEFHFVGPIEPIHQIKQKNVIYHGPISQQEEIKAILDKMDVLVVPSWSEGMPTVIFEAMARGCAILATDVGAISTQVDGRNGWLIEAGNILELTNHIITIIKMDPSILAEKQRQSLDIINKFFWENIIDDHIKVFENVIYRSSLSRQSKKES